MNGVSSSENNEMFGVTNYGIDSFGSWLIIHQLSRYVSLQGYPVHQSLYLSVAPFTNMV